MAFSTADPTYLSGLSERARQTQDLLNRHLETPSDQGPDGQMRQTVAVQLNAVFGMFFRAPVINGPASLGLGTMTTDERMLKFQELLGDFNLVSGVDLASFSVNLTEWCLVTFEEVIDHPKFLALSLVERSKVNSEIDRMRSQYAPEDWQLEAIRQQRELAGRNRELELRLSEAQEQVHFRGVNELKSDFDKFGSREGWKATGLSVLVVVILAAVLVLGVKMLGNVEDLTFATAIGKAALSIPAFAAIYFLGSLSLRFRKSSEWARTAAVQLKTIDDFIAVMEPDQRQKMLMVVGARVYGTSSLGGDDGSNDTVGASHAADVVNAVTELVEKIRG